MKKEVGIKIEIKKNLTSPNNTPYLNVSNVSRVEDAILTAISKRRTIEVIADSLEDAIERILHAMDAYGEKRTFMLWQISKHLTDVSDYTKNRSYDVTDSMKNLIREGKMYRLGSAEEVLFKNVKGATDEQK